MPVQIQTVENKTLTAELLAEQLDGTEYPLRVSIELNETWARHGLLVIVGDSDDLTSFYGVIRDQVGAPGRIWVGPRRLLSEAPDLQEVGLLSEARDLAANFVADFDMSIQVDSLWCEGDEYSWSFEVDHETEEFDILDGGMARKFCRGVVLQMGLEFFIPS